MSFSKLSKVALLLVLVIILSSDQIMCSQGRPLMATHRSRYLLSSSSSHSDEAAAGSKGTSTRTSGSVSPDSESGGGGVGIVEDARPTAPGHSPGAGHAFTNNNGVGRKLLNLDWNVSSLKNKN
ncbi:hypothetical protein ABZP36_020375 [Zizania latifolia]